jgi:hypothetical protein
MPLIENLRSVSLIQGELPPQTAFRPQTLLYEAVLEDGVWKKARATYSTGPEQLHAVN